MKKYYPKGYKKLTIPPNVISVKLSNGENIKVTNTNPGCGSFYILTENHYSFSIDGLWIVERDYKYASDETKRVHHSNYVVSYTTTEIKPTIKCHISGDSKGNNFVSISKKTLITYIPDTIWGSIDMNFIESETKVYLREKDQFSKIIDYFGDTINFDMTFGKLDYTTHPVITNPSGY
jgi:hypothetical protein